MTDVILIKLLVTEVKKNYMMNYPKIHQLKLKSKPYIDNIDTYNRDRALITKSLSDRLGLGQNSLLGA